jgi:CubicO group peptidase (beta-lactamase class C family)
MGRLFSIIIFLGVFSVSFGAAPHGNISGQIDSLRKVYDNIGLSVVVVKDGEIVYSDNFGYNPNPSDPTKGVPIRKKDLFYIASVSKTFVGTAIMQLVERGQLSLEDDVNKYFDFNVRNPNFPKAPITIRMLLSHRSSIKKNVDYDDFDKLNPSLNKDYLQFWNDYMPGSALDYSNLGYVILGAVIEKVSGMRFDDYIQRNILRPLRLRGGYDVGKLGNARFVYPSRYRVDHYVVQKQAYSKDSEKKSQYVLGYSTPILNPAGGMKISAIDLAKYMVMHMNMGMGRRKTRVLTEESEMKMWERQEGTAHGLSFVHFTKVIPGEDLVGMNGANHGIHSSMYFHPEKKYGFVVICNGCNSKTYADSGLNDEVIRMLYNSIIIKD